VAKKKNPVTDHPDLQEVSHEPMMPSDHDLQDIAANLNYRQQQFVRYFCAYGNATSAALQAGYSSKRAAAQGSLMLKNTKIQKAIRAWGNKQDVKISLSVQQRMETLAKIARSDKKRDQFLVIKAIQEMNKMDGLYVQNVNVRSEVSGLSTKELIEQTVEALRKMGAVIIPPPDGWPPEFEGLLAASGSEDAGSTH
jgi:phage terminase small subunit